MSTLIALVGVVMVLSVVADMVNTLVTTSTGRGRWWLSVILYRNTWRFMSSLAGLIRDERRREVLLSTFAPVSVLLLLVTWVTSQVVGFGLIWWATEGVDGASGLFDDIYYSGVVYFTLGFGELVPVDAVPRIGALIEAMAGVLTTALVIGYLPALYAAYSERERKLMTLDDGTEGRITPTNLLLSRAPDGDVEEVVRFFEGWEDWVAGVLETHTTFPMLQLFRSKHRGQNWVTALGVLCDAALQCQVIVGARDRAPYWMLRRSIILFNELTSEADLSPTGPSSTPPTPSSRPTTTSTCSASSTTSWRPTASSSSTTTRPGPRPRPCAGCSTPRWSSSSTPCSAPVASGVTASATGPASPPT